MEGFTLTDTVYTHRFVDWHYHENAYFTFILRGGVAEGNRKEVYECRPGSLLYHNWQDPHYNRKDEVFTRGMQIELDKQWMDSIREGGSAERGLPEGSLRLEHPALKLLFYRIFRESLLVSAPGGQGDVLPGISIQQLLLEVFSLMQGAGTGDRRRPGRGRPRWADRLPELLHAEYARPRSLTELAAALDLHPVHLSRDFRKYFQCTMGEYLRQLRVEHALTLLADPDQTLTAVAFACGFADQSHFIRCFRASQGCSPLAYRRLLNA